MIQSTQRQDTLGRSQGGGIKTLILSTFKALIALDRFSQAPDRQAFPAFYRARLSDSLKNSFYTSASGDELWGDTGALACSNMIPATSHFWEINSASRDH